MERAAQTEQNQMPEELAEQFFKAGISHFNAGHYKEAMKELSQCIQYRHEKKCAAIIIEAYCTLGTIYNFLGYEIVAMERFFSGIEFARVRKQYSLAARAYRKMSWVYRGLGDYEKALGCCEKAWEELQKVTDGTGQKEELGIMIYQGQILCYQNRQEEAIALRPKILEIRKTLEKDKYILNEAILDVLVGNYLGNEEMVNKRLKDIVALSKKEKDFAGFYISYLEICEFALKIGKRQICRQILDELHQNAHDAELEAVQMKVQELEIDYREKYCSQSVYYQACREYIMMQQKNEDAAKEIKRESLLNQERLHQAEEEKRDFEYRSKCDLMTGLLNKAAIEEEIRGYLNNRVGNTLDAFSIIDIDWFKNINDTYGHMLGDKVIKNLAETMKNVFCNGQITGRFGGDEFIVFMKDASTKEKLEEDIYRLKREFESIAYPEAPQMHVTLSIGTAYINEMAVSYEAIFDCADEALYKAKEYGRNIAVFYEIRENRQNHKGS